MSQSDLIQLLYLMLLTVGVILVVATWLLVGYTVERYKLLHKIYRFITVLFTCVLVYAAYYLFLAGGQAFLSDLL